MVAFFMFFEKGYKTNKATGPLRQTFAARVPEKWAGGVARAPMRAGGRGRGRAGVGVGAHGRARVRARGGECACVRSILCGARGSIFLVVVNAYLDCRTTHRASEREQSYLYVRMVTTSHRT
jgi:hypothetical protein